MKKLLASLFALLVCSSASSEGISAKEKIEFYKNCLPSCSESQKKDPSNQIFSDVPFVLDAYCSCYCSRVSMRMDRPMANFLARALIEGANITSNQNLRKLMEESSQKCLTAFY